MEGSAFRTSPASAQVLRAALAEIGALITGRRHFGIAGGWDGNHPLAVPVFVATHAAHRLPGSGNATMTSGYTGHTHAETIGVYPWLTYRAVTARR
jgi:hypothetical protein